MSEDSAARVWSPRLWQEAAAGQQDRKTLRRLQEQHKKEQSMPKMKTKSGAKKRFRVRPGGTVKRGQAFKRHILTKKSTKNKRHLRGVTAVHETNMGTWRRCCHSPASDRLQRTRRNTCLASNVV